MARLRLRARLTENESRRLAERRGGRGRPRVRVRVNRWAVVGTAALLAVAAAIFAVPAVVAGSAGAASSAAPQVSWAASGQPSQAGLAGADLGGADLGQAAQVVVVYVTGAVAAPGVFELPAGARVVDALDQAGGALPEADLAVVNLAAVVQDGERIYVPQPGETPPAVLGGGSGAAGGSGGSGAAGGGLLNVNTATAEELTALPGIGPVLAGRIVDFRQANGPFAALGDLGEVSGIGPKLLAGLAEQIAF